MAHIEWHAQKPRNAKRGGGKKGGGEGRGSLHKETPQGKQFPIPLIWLRFAPPPFAFLIPLESTVRNAN